MDTTRGFRSPVTVGRDREASAIREALARARTGFGTFLAIAGEAGAGKTRLLRDAVDQAGELAVLQGSAPQVGAPPAFAVIAEALRSWTRSHALPTDDLAPFAAGLRHVLPEWPAPAGPPALSEDQLHLLVLEGVLRLLLAASRRDGALVVIDDVQSADPETVEVLRHAAASIAGEPVVVLVGVRTPEGGSFLDEVRALGARGHGSLIELAPLDEAAVVAMCEAIVEAAAPAGLIADIAARTDGVPLLVEHALESYVRSGSLHRERGRVTWSGSAQSPVASTTREFVRNKVGSLPAASRRVVTAAAVLGKPDIELLSGILGDVRAAIDDGIRAGLLERGSGGFRHALIREAVVEDMLDADRASLHRLCAEEIERRHPADPAWLDALAHHRAEAGEPDEAATALIAAGDRDLAAHAPVSAEQAHRRAAAIARDERLRHLARDALAGTLTTLGRWADALQVDEHLEQDPNRLSRMAGNAAQAGQLDRATELVARATAAGAAREPLLALTALVALWRGELDNAEDAAKEALASSADAATECAALDVLGRAADARGRRDAARDAFRRWAERAGAAGLTAQRLQALMELGNLDFMSGGPDEGLRQARALAMDSNAFTTLVLADLSLVWWLGHRARLHEAASLADEAVDLCRRFELGLLPHALVAAGWARNLAAWEAGEALVTEALAIAPGDHDIEILASWTRGDCALRAGRYEVAAERYDAGVQVMRRSPAGVPPPVPFMRAIAIIAARGPDGSAALEEARESPALARLYVNRPWLAFAEALFARASVEEALAAFEANGVFNLAVGLVVGAGLLRDTGASLRRALEVFVDAGADDDAARVRGMLRAAGLPVPRARSMVAGLPGELASRGVTRREADVLQLVADGLSNAQIAQRLFLSVRTVEGNVSQLLRKLQATNRAALVAAGLRLRS